MTFPPGIWFALLLNLAVAAGAVALLIAFWRPLARLAGGERTDPGEWYAESAELAREVRTALEAVDSPADPDRVERAVLPLSGKLRKHARAAPAGVDRPLVQRVFELGMACQKLGIERAPRAALLDAGGLAFEDRVETLAERAERLEAEVRERGPQS